MSAEPILDGPEPFDLGGPLPTGVMLLEASAGTGKTYALAALAVRSIAELGLRASELCVVTFTEAATSELRGRLRDRISEAIDHLSSGEPSSPDAVLTALALDAAGDPLPPAQLDQRLQNLRTALDEFDTATISTIHGFCSRVLAIAGDTATSGDITSDAEQIDELVNDIFVARFSGATLPPAAADRIADVVRLRLSLPEAEIKRWDMPAGAPAGSRKAGYHQLSVEIDAVAALVDEIVALIHQRRREQRRRTFNSLITDARDHIASDEGVGTIATLRRRFSLVMIDEFQDTDQVQWSLFRRAFLEGADPVTTVLVGDPKQSIYRFRAAELSAYLDALHFARTNGRIRSLRVNWRSDQRLVDALDAVFSGVTFGSDEIRFESVEASPDHQVSALSIDGLEPVPLEIRTIGGEDADQSRAIALGDLVAETIRLLDCATIVDHGVPRALRPSDIGILVHANADASRIARALNEAKVPAASSSNDSVLQSAAAAQWRRLLLALERPSSTGSVRSAAITWFLGLDAADVVTLSDDALSELIEQLRSWSTALGEGGLPALMAAMRARGLASHVLASPSGERDLTDLEHIAELLQRATSGRATTPTALLGILDELDESGGDDNASELLGRRIDRDDETVKVLTIHKAKGLEFPVVLLPTLWTERSAARGQPHGEIDGRRRIDVVRLVRSKRPKPFETVYDAHRAEEHGEHLRLLYVALTRAQHRLVLWWNPARPGAGEHAQPLATLLGRATGGDWKNVDVPALVARSQGTIVERAASSATGRVRVHADEPTPALEVAVIDRDLRDDWRVWSFTTITSTAEAAAGSHHDAAPVIGGVDEFGGDDAIDPDAPASPLQAAPGGRAFGTLVHAALERVDFTSPDLLPSLSTACLGIIDQRGRRMAPDALAAALIHSLGSPLGGPLGDRTLLQLPATDRCNELTFHLPLGSFSSRDIAAVMLEHLPATDPLHPWFVAAAAGALDVSLDGLLTGSIDLVARTAIDGEIRYWLADYKTNLISSGEYTASSMTDLMIHSGYGLQATLYLVALHRYLRWRLAGSYDPARHLLGAAYLFLRGMQPGTDPLEPPGVFWFRPPLAAIEALDELLATGVRP